MLSGTEILFGALFIVALVVMSTIDVALTNVNKVAVRRLMDRPKAKAVPSLAALLETRTEALTSMHIVIQLLLVWCAVFVFTALERRQVPHALSVFAAVVLMMLVILLFRHLIPRIITMRSPEVVLLRLFPIFKIVHVALSPLSALVMSTLKYFRQWEKEMEPAKEEDTSEEEIQAFIDAGQEEGILEDAEGEMIQSIVHFGDKVVREVMTPQDADRRRGLQISDR